MVVSCAGFSTLLASVTTSAEERFKYIRRYKEIHNMLTQFIGDLSLVKWAFVSPFEQFINHSVCPFTPGDQVVEVHLFPPPQLICLG